ncbi:uncharacterized protein LOC106472896 isoform X1 [Limulus polyphemus]|uniref:Uncharacterized protein LOC106472896 isoform X1 n=1 Tax=Limulus polyphemus TaxID=6850 RepID=A0ABM1TMP2_LIMPO|nr:uncharacterized protein LOC106472896 isoform X1 [Limulus polyphemus]
MPLTDNSNRPSDSGKICKPLLERRRRARINRCLADLKRLILSTEKEGNHHCKLEKADILGLTVQHLQRVQAQTSCGMGEHSLKDTFTYGYAECVRHVTQYLSSLKEVDSDLVSRITDHMTKSLASVSEEERPTSARVTSTVPDTSTDNEDSRSVAVETSEITDPTPVNPENSPYNLLTSKGNSYKNKKDTIPSSIGRNPLLHGSSSPFTHVSKYFNPNLRNNRKCSSMTSVLDDTSKNDSGISSYLDSPRVEPSISSYLDSPCVEPSTSSYLDSPRVEPSISSYLDSPRIEPSISSYLDSPRIELSVSSYLDSPCVEPSISSHLDSPCVEPSISSYLDSPRVKPVISSYLDSPRVKPSISSHLDSPRVQHDITNKQIIPTRFSVIRRASSSPMLFNEVWRPW